MPVLLVPSLGALTARARAAKPYAVSQDCHCLPGCSRSWLPAPFSHPSRPLLVWRTELVIRLAFASLLPLRGVLGYLHKCLKNKDLKSKGSLFTTTPSRVPSFSDRWTLRGIRVSINVRLALFLPTEGDMQCSAPLYFKRCASDGEREHREC